MLEDLLKKWSQGPSETEKTKCDNAVNTIKGAIDSDPKLSKMNLKIFAQGSYRANTNVKFDSDVDICVLHQGVFFGDYPEGYSSDSYGFSDSGLTFSEFKNQIENALVNRFGRGSITRGNKAFDVHANSYRVDADVVPAFEHRRFTSVPNSYVEHSYISGVEFIADKGSRIINWPDQTHENGVKKNLDTSKRYKSVIRILKNLRNQMQEEKIADSMNVASFLIESLVWNTPDDNFNNTDITTDVKNTLIHVYQKTADEKLCSEWGEVNELKYLFRLAQPWTRDQANKFILASWRYLGF